MQLRTAWLLKYQSIAAMKMYLFLENFRLFENYHSFRLVLVVE